MPPLACFKHSFYSLRRWPSPPTPSPVATGGGGAAATGVRATRRTVKPDWPFLKHAPLACFKHTLQFEALALTPRPPLPSPRERGGAAATGVRATRRTVKPDWPFLKHAPLWHVSSILYSLRRWPSPPTPSPVATGRGGGAAATGVRATRRTVKPGLAVSETCPPLACFKHTLQFEALALTPNPLSRGDGRGGVAAATGVRATRRTVKPDWPFLKHAFESSIRCVVLSKTFNPDAAITDVCTISTHISSL